MLRLRKEGAYDLISVDELGEPALESFSDATNEVYRNACQRERRTYNVDVDQAIVHPNSGSWVSFMGAVSTAVSTRTICFVQI